MKTSAQKLQEQISLILQYTSVIAHVVISLALVMATVLITILFFKEVYLAVRDHSMIHGFLHALGILLLLWAMVELISTEIDFLKGGSVDIAVFLEVAIVVVVREVILLPVEETSPGWIEIGKWVGAGMLLGLTYLFVRLGQQRNRTQH